MKKKINSYRILFIVIIFIQIALLIFYMNSKAGFWLDEVYSYTLANSPCGKIFSQENYKDSYSFDIIWNRWISGQLFKNYISVGFDNRFDYSKVYNNLQQDTQPPVYFCLIHTICSFFPNDFSKWFGLSLNIIFFFITQLILFNLSNLIFNSEKKALLTCLLYGFSLASIDNFIFIGSTAMLPLFYLWALYFFIKSLKSKLSTKVFLELLIIVVLGGLTHYSFLLYVIILSVVFVFIHSNKQDKLLVFFSVILGVLVICFIFPNMYDQIIMSVKQKEILIGTELINTYIFAFVLLVRKLFCLGFPYCIYFSLFLLIFIVVFSLISFVNRFNKRLNKNNLLLILIPFAIVMMLTSFFINYKMFGIISIKYFLAFYPIISIIIIVFCDLIKKPIITIFIIVLSFVFCFNGSHLILRDIDSRYSSLENLLKGNKAILFNVKPEDLQCSVPQLALCDKVYFIPYTNEYTSLQLPPSDGITYLIVFNEKKKFHIKSPKVLSAFISNHKVDVYNAADIK